MKIKLIGSFCTVSVMKAVKIVLYILDELKKCHFHDSFFPLSFQSASFYLHFHIPAKCILLYSQFSMMGLIFRGKWTIRTLKIPIIRLTQRFIFGVSMRGMKSGGRNKRESIGVFSPIKCWVGEGVTWNQQLDNWKETKSKRLLKEICNFTHLHHYQDRFIAVLILPDMLE